MAEEQEYKYDIAPADRRLDNALDAENAYAEKQEEGSGVEPIDPQRLTTDQAVKGGPGDYSWGGYEDQKKNYGPVKPENVSQEDWDNRPKWSRPLEEILHAGSLPALGVADFATDAIGLIPGLKPIDEWWDKN